MRLLKRNQQEPTAGAVRDEWLEWLRLSAFSPLTIREAMLRRILDAEWMVTCDWTQPAKRDALLAEARRVLDNEETK